MKMCKLVIGIAGPSAGGKTTVTNKIFEKLNAEHVNVISFDDYYKKVENLSATERRKINYDHPDAFDIDLLVSDVFKLKNGQSINMPQYDFEIDNRKEQSVKIYPKDILIIEGLFTLLSQELLDLLDIKIYVETDSDICFIRRLKRDIDERGRTVDSVISQYTTTVKPMYEQFIFPTRRKADIIILNGGDNEVGISLVQNTISDYLNKE